MTTAIGFSKSTGPMFSDTEMCETADGTISNELTLSAADSLVSPSVEPGSEEARKMTAGSGLRCLELYKSYSPLGACVRTLLASSAWASTVCFLTWKWRATKRGRWLFQLVPSARRTAGTEYGFWPTPNAFDAIGKEHPRAEQNGTRHAASLHHAVRMWPTPDLGLATGGWSAGTAERKSSTGTRKSGAKIGNSLKWDPALLQDYKALPNGGGLNPTWVEWLMGFPAGRTDLERSEIVSSPK